MKDLFGNWGDGDALDVRLTGREVDPSSSSLEGKLGIGAESEGTVALFPILRLQFYELDNNKIGLYGTICPSMKVSKSARDRVLSAVSSTLDINNNSYWGKAVPICTACKMKRI